MAGPKVFVGVGGKARQVKNIYVGVSGKARKVKRAYVGVGGKARLVYSSDFWAPIGVAAANCLAAYKFKGAASESAALTDLTGHGYTLSKVASNWRYVEATQHYNSPSWSSSGFSLGDWCGLNNTTLKGKDPVSVVARFSGYSGARHYSDDYQCAIIFEGNNYHRLYISTCYATHSFYYPGSGSVGYQFNNANTAIKCRTASSTDTNPSASTVATSGVVGISFNGTSTPTLYFNGNAQTVYAPTFRKGAAGWEGEAASVVVKGFPGTTGILLGMRAFTSGDDWYYNDESLAWNCPARWSWSRYTLQAAAFFSVALTAAQQKEVYQGMISL